MKSDFEKILNFELHAILYRTVCRMVVAKAKSNAGTTMEMKMSKAVPIKVPIPVMSGT
jgi:hypothetical protein